MCNTFDCTVRVLFHDYTLLNHCNSYAAVLLMLYILNFVVMVFAIFALRA